MGFLPTSTNDALTIVPMSTTRGGTGGSVSVNAIRRTFSFPQHNGRDQTTMSEARNPRVLNGSPWQVEIYDSEVMPSDAFNLDDWETAERDYTLLGLQALKKLSSQSKVPMLGCLMSQHEIDVWAWRYPSIYRTRWNGVPSRRFPQTYPNWSQLTWPMPAEVRALAIEAKPQFDDLEIWVPELRRASRVGPSPLLVGVRGNTRYLLARWAEALEPFEEIEMRMESSNGRKAARIRACVATDISFPEVCGGAIALSVLCLLGAALFVVGPQYMQGASGFLTLPTAVVAFLAWRMANSLRPAAVRWACDYAGWILR